MSAPQLAVINLAELR